MKRRVPSLLIALLAALGVWQLSAGAYIHAKAWLAQQLIANAWSRELRGEQRVRPWPWADTWPIARLRVPDADVDLYVLADASGRSLAFGPGWMNGSAPLGSKGNAIIAAHRDTHFRFLRDAKYGMQLWLETLNGKTTQYQITDSHVIDTRSDRLEVDSDLPTLTLMTCYPFDALMPGGPLRYAAIATPVAAATRVAKN